MLDTEDDGVSRAGLGHTEKRSTDGTAKVPSGRSQRSVKISTECPEVRHQHSPNGNALTVRIGRDRKSTRLNSSHTVISYAVFCLKKKKRQRRAKRTPAQH